MRIKGPLGDMSKVDPNASPGERMRQRQATMTNAEKVEALARMVDFLDDVCVCGGSISSPTDHSADCNDPGIVEWRRIVALTPEELNAELVAEGIDPAASLKKMREVIAKHTYSAEGE